MLFNLSNSSLSLVYMPKHIYFVIYFIIIIIGTFISTFILVAKINELFKVPSKIIGSLFP